MGTVVGDGAEVADGLGPAVRGSDAGGDAVHATESEAIPATHAMTASPLLLIQGSLDRLAG